MSSKKQVKGARFLLLYTYPVRVCGISSTFWH